MKWLAVLLIIAGCQRLPDVPPMLVHLPVKETAPPTPLVVLHETATATLSRAKPGEPVQPRVITRLP